MTIAHQLIGQIEDGIDGTDVYVLVTRDDDDLTPEQAIAYLLPLVYRQGSGAGHYYCHGVRAMQEQYRTSEVVCIIEHRYDI